MLEQLLPFGLKLLAHLLLPTVDLRDFEQSLVEIPDEEAFDFVVGLVHPDPSRKQAARKLLPAEYHDLSNSALFDAIVAMAFCLADRDARFRVSVKYLAGLTPDMLSTTGRAIIGGQAGFDTLCERLRHVNGTRAGHHGRIKELGHLAGLSTSESPLDPQIRSILLEKIETNIANAVEAESLETRCPCGRDHEPHSPCVRCGMSRSRPDPRLARRAAAAQSLTGGGSAPRSPNLSLKRVAKYVSSGGEKPKAILCASSEQMCGHINRTRKTHSHE
ncbi:hypothetical protein [Bradyrhizobium japonicum]|uniref:hypothetical protein n=1 Tax=Bradyrhizobium japonicum TaxID=375 RepID=UPI0024C084C0|nr:hypothetical protein [Bradyrhizobium japonicum]